MAKVINREGLKNHALRALGAPVLEINIDEDQLEDRIDDALQYYQEYHSDAIVRTYFKHELTADDVANSYLTIPDSITSVVRILDIQGGEAEAMFNVEYQMRLADLNTFSATNSIQSFDMKMSHLALLDHRLNATELIRFNRHMNRLYIDEGFGSLLGNGCSVGSHTTKSACEADGTCSISAHTDRTACEAATGTWTPDNVWTDGGYVIVEGYEIVNPETYNDVYNDMFLKRYVTALIKRQWGTNMSKFEGMQLPGGVTMNGLQIYQDAVDEIIKLEEEMQLAWQMPDDFIMG